ncbi:MAG: hypothetical protein HYR88_13725 [Verrucomicrobia bacterium]|nr:hypothetical protein [Verrucomicrobiota bacterium]MBI3871261.1 hypothetical protein [Verrucomicrobiota bacterium]
MDSNSGTTLSAGAAGFAAKHTKKTLAVAGIGAVIAVLGALASKTPESGFAQQFGPSYLQAFMFFMSLCLGGLFLTLVHHLFDASWSVPLRRINENLACLAPTMFVLFIPILALAKTIYPWMTIDPPESDHALHAKYPLFTMGGWYGVTIGVFVLLSFLTFQLRRHSVAQDADGAASHTRKLRFYSAWGIFAFALSTTMGAIMWMKGLEHQFFSTMYGVYYFAGSVWTTLATVYALSLVLKRDGVLGQVIQRKQFHDTATLFFAFTVFYAYINFSQYFIIWNGAIPEETFYYVKREIGAWWGISMLIVFGHFVIPFLALLRIDAKLSLPVILPVCAWAWLMHFCDMSFNVMPIFRPKGFELTLTDIGCFLFIGGVASAAWLKGFGASAPYPVRDPRLAEALGVHFHDHDAGDHGHAAPKAVK